jgi:DNA-binding protein YbaB
MKMLIIWWACIVLHAFGNTHALLQMNMGSMMESLKKANEIGRKSKEMQEELEKLRLVGKSANGKVKVTMTGQQIPVGCEIDPSLLSEGHEAVQVTDGSCMSL